MEKRGKVRKGRQTMAVVQSIKPKVFNKEDEMVVAVDRMREVGDKILLKNPHVFTDENLSRIVKKARVKIKG